MRLRLFGGLRLEASDFRRAKPLVLAAYLAVEGARDRRHVAELFWPDAADHMKSLTVALAQARKAVPFLFEADAHTVRTSVQADATAFLERLSIADSEAALALYRGPFLDGIRLRNWGVELEDWVYTTREFLATSARDAQLELADTEAAKGYFKGATKYAEKASLLPGAPLAEPETLAHIHTLLLAGGSVRASDVQKEAAELGVSLFSSKEAAREHLRNTLEAPRPTKKSSLPTRNTSFVGRDLELTEIASLLANPDTSLLTLLGPGGVGKTRLSLQFVQDQVKQGVFQEGIHFVALDALSSAEGLPQSLAAGLGVSLKSDEDVFEQVALAISTRSMLVLLDNFEGVLDGALRLSELLRACPNLKLLVTSRARLNLEEEQVFLVDGLPFPGTPETETPKITSAQAERFDAVSLFVRRAKRARLDFRVDETTLPHILKICELVEGLPLGLELAAVWVKLMPVAEIAEEIGKRLDLLATDLRNVPDRQRSIRSAFEYSWRLLAPKEQDVLAKLSVFRGGFRREAASQIVGATIPVLASLVDKSLLRVSLTGRYDRHALLYQFTQEKLAEQLGTQANTEQKHARYYLHFLEQREATLKGAEQTRTLEVLEEEVENIRTAWRYAALKAWPEDLLRAATALKLFYDAQSRYKAGLESFAHAAAGLDEAERDHHLALGNLLIQQADLAERLGRDKEAFELAGRGLSLLRPLGDQKGISTGLNLLGALALNAAAHDQARGYFKENLALAERSHDSFAKRIALGNLAIVEHHCANFEIATDYYRQTLELCRQTGDLVNVVRTLTNLGHLHLSAAQFQEAEQRFSEALQLANKQATKTTRALLYAGLGSVACELGDYAEAKALLKTSYELASKAGDGRRAADSLAKLGKVSVLSGETARGFDELYEGLRLALESGASPFILSVLTQFAEVISPEKAVELAYLVSAHPASRFADKTRVKVLLAKLEQPYSQVLARAKERSKDSTLEAVAKEMLRQRSLLFDLTSVSDDSVIVDSH